MMHSFITAVIDRHRPPLHLLCTLECDAVVRTVSTHKSLPSLLRPHITAPIDLVSAAPAPPVWIDATRKLQHALIAPNSLSPPAIVTHYADCLEAVTAVSQHHSFADPVLVVKAAWVAESQLLTNLAALPGGSPQYVFVVLVMRRTRQDENAVDAALATVRAVFGEDRVLLLHLPASDTHHHPQNAHLDDGDDEAHHSPHTVGKRLSELAKTALNTTIAQLAKLTDKQRRATRSTFRSWFSTTARAAEPASDQRRLSLSGRVPPPLPEDSLELNTRILADRYVLARNFVAAADAYRLLVSDMRSAVGARKIHEASALEMFALCTAVLDGSKQAVGTALEKAIALYCTAGRRDLAVRATLRAVQFCNEAGYPESAAGVIVRAIQVILPERSLVSSSGSSFVDCALAVLSVACSVAYTQLKRLRRSSFYAFIAASRFAELRLYPPAACMAAFVHQPALLRRPIADHVQLIFGEEASHEKSYLRAVSHFSAILCAAGEHSDPDVQQNAVTAFLQAAEAALQKLQKRWDSAVPFPLVDVPAVSVSTYDSVACPSWRELEDDALEDVEFFRALEQNADAKRQRRVDRIADELRRRREKGGDDNDPGGSIEMKIRRLRDLANEKRKRRRATSLLEQGAVVKEPIGLKVTLRNPLLTPVTLSSLSAVVSMDDGEIYSENTALKTPHGEDSVAQQNGDVPQNDDGGDKSNGQSPVRFFPVDDLNLPAKSSTEVLLQISVDKPGMLRFVGLSWKFTIGTGSGSVLSKTPFVPGFCTLQRRGKRLNKTRRQRASEVPLYEEDRSLLVEVTPVAPRIKATLACKQEGGFEADTETLSMHAGEHRQAKLILNNDGKVPLENVVIRLGTPQSTYVHAAPERIRIKDKSAVMAINLHDETVDQAELIVSCRMRVNLAPGERTEIPVWLRAAVQGSAFKNRSDVSGNTRRTPVKDGRDGTAKDIFVLSHARIVVAYGEDNVRISRVAVAMKVTPSIVVSPRFLREADARALKRGGIKNKNNNNLAGVLLGVEVEHAGAALQEGASYDVTYLSVASRCGWKPMLLPKPAAPKDSTSREVLPSPTVLRINETATFFVLVVHDMHASSTRDEEGRLNGPWTSLREPIALSNSLPPAVESTFFLHADNVGQTSDIAETGKPPDEHLQCEAAASMHFVVHSQYAQGTSSARFRDRELAFVAIRWESDCGAVGEIHIPPIDPLRWMSDEQSVESKAGANLDNLLSVAMVPLADDEDQDPIIVSVNHVSSLEHRFFPLDEDYTLGEVDAFPTAFPAVVRVFVSIRNISSVLQDVMFSAPTSGGVADGERGRFWAGDVSMALRSLPPGGERTLHLAGILLAPGTYNMASFTIVYQASFSNMRSRRQIMLPASYVTVSAKEADVQCVGDLFAPSMGWDSTLVNVTDVAEEDRGLGRLTPTAQSLGGLERSKNMVGETRTIARTPTSAPRKAASTPTTMMKKIEASPKERSISSVTDSNIRLERTASQRLRDVKRRLAPSAGDEMWNDADTDDDED